jgi:hypothetical protein
MLVFGHSTLLNLRNKLIKIWLVVMMIYVYMTHNVPPRPGLRRVSNNQVEAARLSTMSATADSSQRPHFSPLQCPRRRHVGADESSTPRSPSAAPAATADLSATAKQQQTEPRHPKTSGPRQVECPKGHSN